MGTYSVVDCSEEHGSQFEDWGMDGMTCGVTLRCAWSDRHALVDDLLGNQREWPHGTFTTRPTASSARITPVPAAYTASDQAIEYTHDALVSVGYDVGAVDLLSEALEPTSEFLKLDHRRFRWGAANGEPLIEGEAPGQLIRGLNLVRTLYGVEGPLPTTLLDLTGCCNDVAYVSGLLGLTFPAQTLLYHPPNLSRTIKTSGAEAWTIGLKFTFKRSGWNTYWRPKTQSYAQIYIAGGSVYNSYTPADFSDFLF